MGTLLQSRFFAGLAPAAVTLITARLRWATLDRGDVLFREGEQGRSMFLVVDGELVALQSSESAAISLVRYRSGDFLGVTALVEVAPRPWTVVAATPARLLELTDHDFAGLYREDPESYVQLLHNVIRELLRNLHDTGGKVSELASEATTDADTGDSEATQLRLDCS